MARPTGTQLRNRGTARRSPSCAGTHVERRPVELHRAHRRDAAARRGRLESRDAIRGAVRQAQPARDARHELVLVDGEDAERRSDAGRGRRRHARAGTSRRQPPARELAVGIERVGDPRHERCVGQRAPEPVEPGRTGFAEQPPAVHVGGGAGAPPARSSRVGGDVHRADADLRQPPDAGASRRAASAPSAPAPDRDPAAVRARRAARADPRPSRRRAAVRSPSTSAATPSTSTCVAARRPRRCTTAGDDGAARRRDLGR